MIKARAEHDVGHPERPLVIAYYTTGTPYEGEAEVLKDSLELMEYSYLVCGISNQGSWQANTQAKAPFVQQMLQEHEGQPLLYLDVDAVMEKPPVLLDKGKIAADIAAVHFANRGGAHKGELLSGTLYLGNTDPCRQVVRRWIEINTEHPVRLPGGRDAWDQRTLEMAIQETVGAVFVELPQEYTYIEILTRRHYPDLQAVIKHTRGARRFKHLIDGKKGYAR